MSELKEKLARLNKIHLKKTGPKENLFRAYRKSVKKKNTEKKVVCSESIPDTETWPQIEDDTAHFTRITADSGRIEKLIPNISGSWKNENDYLLIDRKLDKFWIKYPGFISHFHENVTNSSLKKVLGIDCELEELCFLDLETCGLRGNPLFLIGIAFFQNRNLLLRQYFARNYVEEAAVIDSFWKDFENRRILVTFNGKSFDWPFLEDRTFVLGNEPVQPIFHFDLLHASRHHWKGQLPDYKLQTLEKILCRRSRYGDIPGSEIPQAYRTYVDNPDKTDDMISAIHHNALDVITMAELILIMAAGTRCIGGY